MILHGITFPDGIDVGLAWSLAQEMLDEAEAAGVAGWRRGRLTRRSYRVWQIQHGEPVKFDHVHLAVSNPPNEITLRYHGRYLLPKTILGIETMEGRRIWGHEDLETAKVMYVLQNYGV